MKDEVSDLDSFEILLVEPNKEYKIDNLRFKTTYSYNINKEFHQKKEYFVGYILNLEGIKYYVAEDINILEENKYLEVDVALAPIGGKFTMDYQEAALFINAIKPKIVISIYWFINR